MRGTYDSRIDDFIVPSDTTSGFGDEGRVGNV
jgi:hypothetical protein